MHLPALARDVIDFVYPATCPVCGASAEASRCLCLSCAEELDHLAAAPGCDRCAVPLAEAGAPCPWCDGKSLYPFEKIVKLGVYQDPLKHLIHQMKYHRRWALAEVLADRLFQEERVKGLLTETDCIMPVPLHPMRQISRGYNQAEILAKRFARRCRLKLVKPIVRLKHTQTQTAAHSRARRAENLKDAFGLIDPRSVRGRHVVIVDDVMTTGATLQSVGRALKPAKPASLCAIVLAVADPRGRDFQQI